MSGYTYAQARLAVDEYGENKKKMDYTNEVVDLYNAALEQAEDDSLATGIFGGLMGLFFGDYEDALLGYNIGLELGYHGSWEYGDGNDIIDNMLDYESAIGDVKFNQAEFEDGLLDLQDDMDDYVDDKRVVSLFGIMGNLQTYGDMGGFDSGGRATDDLGMFERAGYNIKEMFGAGGVTVPKEFENEVDPQGAWLKHIMMELSSGKTLDEVLTKLQQKEIFGKSTQSLNIEELFKHRSFTWPVDEDEE